jgi:serine/threonine protein phosphatase PrpC
MPCWLKKIERSQTAREVPFVKKFFRNVFGQNKLLTTEVPTKPISQDQVLLVNSINHKSHLAPPQLIAGCAQSVGKQRDHNEDALFTLTTTLTSDHSNLPFGLYIVADGMGGHQHGELASGIAVRSMASYVVRKLYMPLLSVKPTKPDESLQEIMQEGVLDAQKTIIKQVPGGGTTLTAVLILGNQMTIAHVGDSRAYLIEANGNMEMLTRDHSLVKRLVELGQISKDEAANHPQRNVLYRALGQGEPFEPDINTIQLPESGHLLLCSDGLWGVLSETELLRAVQESPTPEHACQRLIDAANEAGGPDNITAILVHLPE